MSYGIVITTDYGQTISTTSLCGLVHDAFVVAGNATGSKSYPELAGFTIYAAIQKYASQPNALVETSVSYSSGYPVLSWFPSGSGMSPANAMIIVVIK